MMKKVLVMREDTNDWLVSVESADKSIAVAIEDEAELKPFYEKYRFRIVVETQLLPKLFKSWKFVCDLSEDRFYEGNWDLAHAQQDATCPEFAGWWPEKAYVYEVEPK